MTNETVEKLIADLNSADENVRKTSARTLGEIGDEKAIRPLIALLKDKNILIQLTVANSISQIGTAASEPLLAAFQESDPTMKVGVVRTLGRLGDKKAVEPLLAALPGAGKELRMNIWGALGQIGDPAAVEPLLHALKGDWDECMGAVEALGRIGDKRAVDPLIEVIKHGDYTIRGVAAKALGQIGDQRALPALRSILSDPQPVAEDIRKAANEAIQKLEQTHL